MTGKEKMEKKQEGGSRLSQEYLNYSPEEKRDTTREGEPRLNPKEERCFRKVLETLIANDVPFAVGAAFARYEYTGIWRQTKDLDVFLQARHLRAAMAALEAAGLETEVASEHWLAKAHCGRHYVDLIFGTGHGHLPVDEEFFRGAQLGELFGVQVPFIAPEEMIASAAYVNTRHRFDGSEVLHLILKTQGKLDWDRIVKRLGRNRELLLWELILFDYVYPGHSDYLPKELMEQLFDEVRERWDKKPKDCKFFRGSIIDPYSFTVDVEDWGYKDTRKLDPLVNEEGESL